MADNTIDKALPNEPRKEITLPGEEEIQETLVEEVEAELEKPGEVEQVQNEDGSVDINFDPKAAAQAWHSWNTCVSEPWATIYSHERTSVCGWRSN